jgi:hypothetical protein
MGQLGFFDAERRLAALSEKGDPLEAIAALVPWESFRADIEAVVLTPEEAKKSKAGRKPLDALVLFRMLVLQALYNLNVKKDKEFDHANRPDGWNVWLTFALLPAQSASTTSTTSDGADVYEIAYLFCATASHSGGIRRNYD